MIPQPSENKVCQSSETLSESTNHWVGLTRNVSTSVLVMDVDRVLNSKVDKDNNTIKRLAFDKMVGNRYSAMEHQVPELLYSKEDEPAEGISAIKAIAIAAAEGQKIWTITKDNLDIALTSLMLNSEVETEIRNSVNNGKVVTAHEKRITVDNWIGEGYIILDPNTGYGAYKITGGMNGGVLDLIDGALQKVIDQIGVIEDSVGDSKYLLKPLKKLIGQVRLMLVNFQGLVQILKECNAAAGLLGIILYGILFMIMLKMIKVISALIAGACSFTGKLAGVCTFGVMYVVMPHVLEFVNNMMSSTKDTIISGGLCKVGT